MSKHKDASDHRADGYLTQRMSEAIRCPDFVDDVIDWYIRVFNDQAEGEWAESWTPDQVRKKLFADTASQHDRSFIVSWRDGGVLAGATIIYVDTVDRLLGLADLPPNHQTPEQLADINRHLDWVFGPGVRVAQYRELGVVRQHRQGIGPVGQMIARSLVSAIQEGARYGVWWTSKSSRLFPIVSGLENRVGYDFNDSQGHVLMYGECDQVLRRLNQPEAMIKRMIADRLKRMGLSRG